MKCVAKSFLILAGTFLSATTSAKTRQEFHWFVCGEDKKSIEAKLDVSGADSTKRDLAYLDTSDQAFYSRGAVLRIRANRTKTEVTAKLVFDNASQFKKSWLTDENTTCEFDYTPVHKSFACSVDVELPGMVLSTKSAPQLLALFSSHQRNFFADHGMGWPQADLVQKAGPVEFVANKYNSDEHDLRGKWSVEDLLFKGEHLFDGVEVSVRLDSNLSYSSATSELGHRQLRLCPDQGSKTKAVLDRFLGQSSE